MERIGENPTDLQGKAGKSVLDAFLRTCAHRMVRLVKKCRLPETFRDEKIAQSSSGCASLFGGFSAKGFVEIEGNHGLKAFAAAE